MLRRFTLAVVLILLATPILTFNVRPAKCAAVLSQNFDGEPTGSIPQGWNAHDPSQLAINDTVYYGSAGKSARYAAHAAIGRTFEEQHGPMELSVAMRTEVPDSFMLYIDDGSGDYRGANIYFMLNGNLEYYDGDYHNICPFSVNTWYQIKMEIDVLGNTYDIYVDGSLKVRGAHFRGFGQTTHLSMVEFGGNSLELPVGFIDDLSISTQVHISPVTPVMRLAGSLDYLLAEDAKVRLDALVKDNNTMAPVSDANVTVQIYYPNGSLWISDKMSEKLNGTGIYEWESSGTIHEMSLDKGVYLAYAQASVGNATSTDILLFHVDPPSETESTPTTFELFYAMIAMILIAGTMIGIALLRQHRKLLRISEIQIDLACS